MRIQISGRVLLAEGRSKNFSASSEVSRVGKGEQGNPKLPVGQFLQHEVKCKIQDGAIVVTVLFGAIDKRKDYGLPLQQHSGDQVFVIIDDFQGQAIGVAELSCYVTPSNEDLVELQARLTKKGYVGEADGN